MEPSPSTFSRIFEFGWALVPHLWLLITGVVLVIEPAIETLVSERRKAFIDGWWPSPKRHVHFRWAAVAALMVASFLAFDDVNMQNRTLQKNVRQVTGERDEARGALKDERTARTDVERQRDEARNELANARVAPNEARDRRIIKEQLQKFYVGGIELLNRPVSSDAEFSWYVNDYQTWAQSTAAWIEQNMGPPAKARFLDTYGRLSYTYARKFNQAHNSLINDLTNMTKTSFRSD